LPTPPRVAIVEGDDLIRQLLTRWLEQAGFVVDHTVAHQLSKHEVDLVVANVHGTDSAQRLVSGIRAQSSAPLLLISARFPRGAARSATLAQALGAQAVLPVPFSEAELMGAIQRILNAPG
jgi:DNA-binding response OmpR family regulator